MTTSAVRPKSHSILCLVTDAYGGFGGIALYNRDAIEAMCSDPATEHVVVLPRVQSGALETIPDKVFNDQSSLGGAVNYIAALLRTIRSKRQFSLVYCAHVNLIPLAQLAAAWLKVPWVLCTYGVEAWEPIKKRLSRAGMAKANRIISVSAVTRERILKWCPIDPDKCVVVHNAVHTEQFSLTDKDPALEEKYGLRGRKVIMTVGRLDPTEQAKGFDRVIEMLPQLRQHYPGLMYLIVGKGDDQARLAAIAERVGVTDAVIFTGFVSEEQKPAYYALADAYVMPSVGEGFGYVYVEAMACGIPVVGSNADGSRDALREGMLGTLVDPFDQPALIAATLDAIAKPRSIPEGVKFFEFDAFRERFLAVLAAAVHTR